MHKTSPTRSDRSVRRVRHVKKQRRGAVHKREKSEKNIKKGVRRVPQGSGGPSEATAVLCCPRSGIGRAARAHMHTRCAHRPQSARYRTGPGPILIRASVWLWSICQSAMQSPICYLYLSLYSNDEPAQSERCGKTAPTGRETVYVALVVESRRR